MAEQRNHTPDIGPGLADQLEKIDTSKLAKKTPRSRLLADINESLREFERNPEAHKEQIKELQELAEAFSEFEGNDEAALADTQAQLDTIKAGQLDDVRGGNGTGEQKDALGPASAEAGPHPLWEELTRSISEVAGRMTSLDDERKKTTLGKQLELLRVYQRVKPADRNSVWEQRVRETLARIRSIESPKRERPVRVPQERPVPKAEEAVVPAEAVPEAVELKTDGEKLVARFKENAIRIEDKLQSSRETFVDMLEGISRILESNTVSKSNLEKLQPIFDHIDRMVHAGWSEETGGRKKWASEMERKLRGLELALTAKASRQEREAAAVAHTESGAEPAAQAEAPEREPELFADEREYPVRAAALYTINKLKSYAELQHAEDGTLLGTKEQRDARFKELVKKYWTEFTVHGAYGRETDPKTGKPKLEPWTDLDGSACLFLLREAGIDVGKDSIKYVSQGESSDSGVVLDTSNKFGVIADEGGKRITFDHHTPDAPRDTSATRLLYDTLSDPEIGLLKKEPWMKGFVEYVAKEDSKAFTDQEARALFENYGYNFASLARNMDFGQMKKFFTDQARTRFTPYDKFPDEYLNKFKFTYNPLRNNRQKRTLEQARDYVVQQKNQSIEAIKSLEEKGMVLDTGDRYGKVLIDTGTVNAKGELLRSVPMDFDAVRASGYGAYLVWLEGNGKKQFFLKTVNRIDFDLQGAFNARGHYMLKGDPTTDFEVTMQEVLDKLKGEQRPATEQRATIATEASGVYDPEQEVGAPQAPVRAEVVAPVEAAIPVSNPKPQLEAEEAEYEKHMLDALELEDAEDGARETMDEAAHLRIMDTHYRQELARIRADWERIQSSVEASDAERLERRLKSLEEEFAAWGEFPKDGDLDKVTLDTLDDLHGRVSNFLDDCSMAEFGGSPKIEDSNKENEFGIDDTEVHTAAVAEADRKQELETRLQEVKERAKQALQDGDWDLFGDIYKEHSALKKEYVNL